MIEEALETPVVSDGAAPESLVTATVDGTAVAAASEAKSRRATTTRRASTATPRARKTVAKKSDETASDTEAAPIAEAASTRAPDGVLPLENAAPKSEVSAAAPEKIASPVAEKAPDATESKTAETPADKSSGAEENATPATPRVLAENATREVATENKVEAAPSIENMNSETTTSEATATLEAAPRESNSATPGENAALAENGASADSESRAQWAPRNNQNQGGNAPRGGRAGNANHSERDGNASTRGNRNDSRDERSFENRGLRFRGRDGRTEVRGRSDSARGDNTRNDNRGRAPLNGRNRGDDENGGFDNRNSNRLAGSRDAGNRDNNRDDARANRDDFDLLTLEEKTLEELQEIATGLGVENLEDFKKSALAYRILEAQAAQSGNGFKRGILEILSDGKGFLRTEGYHASDEDVYVSQSQIKRFNLKTGDVVSGQVRAPKEMERYYGLLRVEAMNGESPEVLRSRKEFEKLTPIFPDEKFNLETTQDNITARIIDLVSPIGKGQRGLIVAPPKAGKTTLIKNIANSIAANHPEVELIVLLIDERPEEVTDISRSVRGEVVASTFDEQPENHMHVADMVMEKAKRMVEQKKDVVILLDSITRLSRASNLVVNPSGRTMSGGLDPAAMYRPKRMFGAARNIEEGGSLTILATALVDTGSRMDDYIFEEFKGTGNLDLVLDRNLFDQRVFPAIDINKSGTRRDDLLLSKEDLSTVHHLRRTLSALDNAKAINLLIDRLKNTKTNADFMEIVRKSTRQSQAQ